MKSALVLGTGGFIGSHVAHHLAERGFSVWGVYRTANFRTQMASKFLRKSLIIDFADLTLSDNEKCFQGQSFDLVVNAVGNIYQPNLNEMYTFSQDFVATICNLLSFLDGIEFDRLVHLGSSDEYGDSPSPQSESVRGAVKSSYGLTRRLSMDLMEAWAAKANKLVVGLRLYLIYGSNQLEPRLLPYLINQCFTRTPIRLKNPEVQRDLMHVSDLCRLIETLAATDLPKGFHLFNVGTAKPYSVREVAQYVSTAVAELTGFYNEILCDNWLPNSQSNKSTYPDTSKISCLGWSPSIFLEEGLKKTVLDQFSNEKNNP